MPPLVRAALVALLVGLGGGALIQLWVIPNTVYEDDFSIPTAVITLVPILACVLGFAVRLRRWWIGALMPFTLFGTCSLVSPPFPPRVDDPPYPDYSDLRQVLVWGAVFAACYLLLAFGLVQGKPAVRMIGLAATLLIVLVSGSLLESFDEKEAVRDLVASGVPIIAPNLPGYTLKEARWGLLGYGDFEATFGSTTDPSADVTLWVSRVARDDDVCGVWGKSECTEISRNVWQIDHEVFVKRSDALISISGLPTDQLLALVPTFHPISPEILRKAAFGP